MPRPQIEVDATCEIGGEVTAQLPSEYEILPTWYRYHLLTAENIVVSKARCSMPHKCPLVDDCTGYVLSGTNGRFNAFTEVYLKDENALKKIATGYEAEVKKTIKKTERFYK